MDLVEFQEGNSTGRGATRRAPTLDLMTTAEGSSGS
jgi:hypothetical protein